MIRKQQFINHIKEGTFRQLFIEELGWNGFRGQSTLPTITVDDTDYQFHTIAERNGFQILHTKVNAIPPNSLCRKIDRKLIRQSNDYIAIYQLGDSQHHLWVVPVRNNEKRDLVLVEYTDADKSDFLFSKVEGFSFALGETTNIVDLKAKVQGAFAVNSEKITKDFYAGFKKEHKAFTGFISGITAQDTAKADKDRQWYASVMLNRLMFCYFIQKKGFLNFEFDYLRKRFDNHVKGEDNGTFFKSFYLGFLRELFSDGLNDPKRSREFIERYGKIPYLNGGMFDTHPIEKEYEGIDIEDEAFDRLFAFFDKWNWHLDTRITATQKDINPDVLGYIFEQYINDRAQMGAYYTKEDITEYIGRNCILPFLFDKTRTMTKDSAKDFEPDGFVWRTLKASGDKYVFDAVKKGYDHFGEIPENIRIGIITDEMRKEYSETPVGDLPTGHVPLAELRADWNKPTPEPWGLPTEIWRETIERLQRCDDIIGKIRNGEITQINDFITYNLDIRTFAQDLLAKTEDHLFVKHFYKALQSVTILDPTCGSGAFLFAALNILEPLYETCIDRMQEFRDKNPKLFEKELAEVEEKYRSNIQYFIYKSIILRNLYGVDIMAEATEIAKLRLFLKMVAVVEVDKHAPNMGLDPLPDIDFNIRCGNTLVGYANEEELDKDLNDHGGDMMAMLANEEYKQAIEQEMQVVASTYAVFRSMQLVQSEDMKTFKEAKAELRERLKNLNTTLNLRLFSAMRGDGDPSSATPMIKRSVFMKWLSSHQPFHWLAEFYDIIHGNGGFDVIIGNPPYVEFPSKDVNYKFDKLVAKDCGNLYGCCIERGFQIGQNFGRFSFIIPVAITCSKRMSRVIDIMRNKSSYLQFANFDDRPGKLFEMIEHLRASIFISARSVNKTPQIFSTSYNRWYTQQRCNLFKILQFVNVTKFVDSFLIPKYSRFIENHINDILLSNTDKICKFYGPEIDNVESTGKCKINENV